nr:MAG TPA: hypothetical protein [Caudoviricetes sp.]
MIEKVRLALYEPWGKKIATITDYSSLSWVHPLNCDRKSSPRPL